MSPHRATSVLLVDDQPENLLALRAVLDPLEVDVAEAGSGEEALKRLLQDEFAVILLDVQMPKMDGFETAELIKRRSKTQDIPIIFLTAIDKEPHHAFRGYSAGAVDFLAKPFDPWVLRAKVSVFVDLWTKTRQLEAQAAAAREHEARWRALTDAVDDVTVLLRTAPDDPAVVAHALEVLEQARWGASR